MLPQFEVKKGQRDSYNYTYGIIGEVIDSKEVPPNQVSPNWWQGEWAHIVKIKTSDGIIHELGGSKDVALDFEIGTTVVIGQININGYPGGLDFYSDKHCAVITSQSLEPIRKLR